MAEPLISVVVPVHDGKDHLAAALDSVFAQTYRPLQVIVVDDGSTDDSSGVAAAYRDVLCIQQGNSGALRRLAT
jgi:glycosyltransferase involved in cell wall biosynthesis